MSKLLYITGLYADLGAFLKVKKLIGTLHRFTCCICGGSIALMKMREESPDSVEYRTI